MVAILHRAGRLPVRGLLTLTLILVGPSYVAAQTAGVNDGAAGSTASLQFSPSDQGTWLFDTGLLTGRLRTAQLSFGLHELQHVLTGSKLAGGHGVVNIYRVFSDGQRHGGGGWDWPARAVRAEQGGVVIESLAEEGRPFVLRATYCWTDPGTIDLTIDVTPQQDLHGFEVFLASYFAPGFCDARACVEGTPESGGKETLMNAKETYGTWLAFPRDEAAVKMIQDGRWHLPPNPVDWVIMPTLKQPLAVRRDGATGVTALLMAPRQDCFAVSMPHETETHYSVYLSLFGRDLKAGATATAHARMRIMQSPDDETVLKAYREYEESLEKR